MVESLGSEQQFLAHDSGAGERRFLIFTMPGNTSVLKASTTWMADGTFKTSPQIFTQIYTLHGAKEEKFLPLVFVLMTHRDAEMYTEMLSAVKSLENGLQQERILTDFERAALNAFSSVFPLARQACCNFHLNQCFVRKMASLHLKHRYKQHNADFALCMRMIPSLAFMRPEDLEMAFEALEDFLGTATKRCCSSSPTSRITSSEG